MSKNKTCCLRLLSIEKFWSFGSLDKELYGRLLIMMIYISLYSEILRVVCTQDLIEG